MVDIRTGRDLKNVLERKNLLGNDAGIQTMKEILLSIEKTDVATKLDQYLAIGKYFVGSK